MGLLYGVDQMQQNPGGGGGGGGGGLGGIGTAASGVGSALGLGGLPGLDDLNRVKVAESMYGGVDPNGDMARTAGQAEAFGRHGANEFRGLGREGAMQRDMLRRRAMGQDSLSAEQLRQSYQQLAGQQMGLAAGARPAMGAAAARQASMNVANAQAGMAGQQAIAGIQERAAAEQQLGNAILGARNQALQGALGGQQNAIGGYNNIEQARTGRYQAVAGQPTEGEQLLSMAGGVAGMFGLSDRRAKKKIRRAEREAEALMETVKPYKWEYKDPANGEGEFVGIMAQDLERSKAGRRAVVDTPRGKMVDGARLATAIAATLPGIHKRLRKLEAA